MHFIKRMKTLIFSCAAVAMWIAPLHAQGTLPIALVQQIDVNGQPLAGCLTYFYVAGTVATPQNVFQDFGLSQPLPNPLTCDQTGRVPMFWIANGLVHVRLTDATGVVVIDTTMQVLGPSSGGGGGGGGSVDPTTILATGDEKVRHGTGALTGFVRENGLTIGNAVSGGTERANADTQNLFVYLYGADPNLVVSGGRTGNALADYNAAKTIALPDMRGASNVGLADMGNSATTIFTALYAGCSVTTLGAACGSQSQSILQANFPSLNFSISGISINNGPLVFGGNPYTGGCIAASGGCAGGSQPDVELTNTGSTSVGTSSGNVTITSQGSAASGGSGTPLATVQPSKLRTFYMKL